MTLTASSNIHSLIKQYTESKAEYDQAKTRQNEHSSRLTTTKEEGVRYRATAFQIEHDLKGLRSKRVEALADGDTKTATQLKQEIEVKKGEIADLGEKAEESEAIATILQEKVKEASREAASILEDRMGSLRRAYNLFRVENEGKADLTIADMRLLYSATTSTQPQAAARQSFSAFVAKLVQNSGPIQWDDAKAQVHEFMGF